MVETSQRNDNEVNAGSIDKVIKTPPLHLSDQWKCKQVEDVLSVVKLNGEIIKRIQATFENEIEAGLSDKKSSLQMENTYIPELPDGSEEGQFLALDLGGTNFRVILMHIKKGLVTDEIVKHYHISDELRLGSGLKLFDFLAASISDFVHEYQVHERVIPLGFTFSFPMHQTSLDSGILVTWTKSFKSTGVEKQDVVKMLKDAIHRREDNHVEIVCILNDSTGTLLQGASLDHRTAIGLILGTGSNACYLEKADKVKHWETERHGEKNVVIDIEWGAFGDNGVLDFIRSEFDRCVDDNSLIQGSFTFEKYISGKYLGELVRVVLCRLVRDGLLFNGVSSPELVIPNSFRTSFVSLIEQDSVDGLTHYTEKVLDDLGLTYNDDDILIVQRVCHLLSLRATLLVAVCTAVLVRRIDRDDITIAVDGSLYKYHPRLKHWLQKYIQLLVPDKTFRLLLAEDGSGKGAGLASAVALKLGALQENK
nr:hexokinase 1 [Cacopsylla chinensis]